MAIAKIFMNGRSQAVRLPAAFRFDTDQVYVRRDPATGDVVLSKRPEDLTALYRTLDACRPDTSDFMLDRYDPPLASKDIF